MGKSPGKWIKTVLFGKKSSKSNLSKDGIINKKTSITSKPPSKDFDDDSMVISSPVPHVVHTGGEHTELEKTASHNLTSDTAEVARSNLGLNIANEDEYIKLEQAAIMAQAAFRGYLARRAFWALKGIIRLQAHIRGRLVRKQAVATLRCMRAIVEFQALARGAIVRLSSDNPRRPQQCPPEDRVDKKRMDLLEKSLQSEKLSTNAFGAKLLALSHATMPLSIQYDPAEPNSVRNWLERWSASRFWEPLPQLKKVPVTKPKRKPMKSHHEEIEPARPKRSVRRAPAPNLEGNLDNSVVSEKPKPSLRKVSSQQTDAVQEQSHSELEKVKLSLRKISVSTAGTSEKPEIATQMPEIDSDKASGSPNPVASEQATDQPFEKVNELNVEMTEFPHPELVPVPHDVLQDDHHLVETEPPEINGKEYNPSKENQKTRRRKSFPAKQEHQPESVLQTTPTLPSYMAATESAKAKLRAQAAAKAAEDGAENGFIRRHSLPSSTRKLSLQSPRVQKPLQTNAKGWNKSVKPQISARDDRMAQTGWKR